jgi:Copper type II ascorbate-dependent monooxygenase, C-terminal domain
MTSRWILLSVITATGFAATPTFDKDVAPILFEHCSTCHRPGEIGPMPLLSYEQARPWAKSIRAAVASGQMPPWHATQAHGIFSNDRRLTDADKQTIIAWVDGGAPQGNPKDLPAAPTFPEGWMIGKPDAVVSMKEPFEVKPEGTIAYQYFEIPTNFTEDKWVQAIEVRPGVRSVVHHVLVFARDLGPPKPPTVVNAAFKSVVPKGPFGGGGSGGRGVLIATTAPGTNAMTFPAGSAVKLKAGTILTLQVHYTANGKPASDQSSVGFIFAKETPTREMHNSAFINATLKLPAGDADTAVDSEIEFTEDTHIWALFPHTHLRGKSWEYRMVYPDGRTETILSVPHYDFNWQTYYEFSTPLAAPKGSHLQAVARYDNSPNNPSNPDAKVDVRWGEQTWQEMQYSGISYTVDEHQSESTAAQPQGHN